MASKGDSYIIVGAGVFGASTSLHLANRFPGAKIRLIDREDFPCRLGASWDCNKIIRTDYLDALYAEKALEAMDLWSNDPLYKPYYHESGIIWLTSGGSADLIVDNARGLGAGADTQMLTVDETRAMFGGLYADGDFNGVNTVLYRKTGGWARADKALAKVIATAVEAGVEYIKGAVESLTFDEHGGCSGVKLRDGNTSTAQHTILCTGAGTAKLLADSAPERDDLQANGRIIAAAIYTACVQTEDKDLARLIREAPVFSHQGMYGRGGCIPAGPDSPFKYWTDTPTTNTIKHSSGREFSAPPSTEDYSQWEFSEKMKGAVEEVNKRILGKLAERVCLTNYRVCWESSTMSQDFIISPHPACKGLYIATAGSFHGFKFLPILGKYVVQMLEGELDTKLAARWSWNQQAQSEAEKLMALTKELKDMA